MLKSEWVGDFDLDITLRDASLDPELRPSARMIAAASLGIGADDAYYSVRELREAVTWVHEGAPGGKAKLASILSNDGCDDYQRCIYYAVAGRGIVGMLDDLRWLEDLLERRGRLAGKLRRAKVRVSVLVDPYVAKEPDGPVGEIGPDFSQGPSWWMDRSPAR